MFNLKTSINIIVLTFVLIALFINSAYSGQEEIIAGVYYLISRNDPVRAEEYFQRVILSGEQDNFASAFYFLGKIYYERALSGVDVALNVSKAKAYLTKADEYGLVYDRLHPPLLREVNEKYPNIPESNLEIKGDKAKAMIEIDQGKYRIESLQVSREMGVKKENFSTNKEIDLYGGTLYRMKPDVTGSHRSIQRMLVIVGIGIAIWLVRG